MLINGTPHSNLPLNDRAIAYGDGLFETIRLHNGRTVYLEYHLERLKHGCSRLGILCDFACLLDEIARLEEQFTEFSVLKIIISRSSGGRGYRPDLTLKDIPASQASTRILTLHNMPHDKKELVKEGIQTFLCQQRLALQPALAGIKHLNRLEQVLASQEWPSANFHEGIMLDLSGNVIEGTKSNIFIAQSGKLVTPELSSCGVDGVMRKVLMNTFQADLEVKVCSINNLLEADEVFVCNSVFGVWPVRNIRLYDHQLIEFCPANFCQRAVQVFSRELANNVF